MELWYGGTWGENAGGGDANRIPTLEAWGQALSDRRVPVDLRLSIRIPARKADQMAYTTHVVNRRLQAGSLEAY